MQQTQKGSTVMVVGDTIDGVLSTGSRDLGAQARRVGEIFGGETIGVLVGHNAAAAAETWSSDADMAVTLLDHPQYRYPNPAATAAGLQDLVEDPLPRAICLPHTMRGCQIAGTLAWRTARAGVTGVEAIRRSADGVVLERAVLGGKVRQTVAASAPLILTLMPGVFPRGGPAAATPSPRVAIRSVALPETRTGVAGIRREAKSDPALEKARVVVAGGRGLGGPEGAGLLEAVADMFGRSAVGGSRGACDLGWLPHASQVGETGRTVAPALYIACGISGASQHLAGMRGAQTIIAVNTDPRAAIFNVAHLAVIENLTTFLPLLRQRYDETFNQGDRDDADR